MTELEKFDSEILTITQRRGEVYGDITDNFKTIARMQEEFAEIQESHLRHALNMVCLKLARIKANPYYRDSYVDAVGYLRCAMVCVDDILQASKGSRIMVVDSIEDQVKGE